MPELEITTYRPIGHHQSAMNMASLITADLYWHLMCLLTWAQSSLYFARTQRKFYEMNSEMTL